MPDHEFTTRNDEFDTHYHLYITEDDWTKRQFMFENRNTQSTVCTNTTAVRSVRSKGDKLDDKECLVEDTIKVRALVPSNLK